MIYIKYKYEAIFGPCEELYDMKIETTTIKYIRNKLNETFIYGELKAKPYFIYKGREQEDKEKHDREPMKYYYTYTRPVYLMMITKH